MIKVGESKIFDEKKGKTRHINYLDVEYGEDGWVDSSKFLPADFDLVFIKSPDHIKTVPAWINGKNWDGLNLKKEARVLYWKKDE